jgi:hypothetical protein
MHRISAAASAGRVRRRQPFDSDTPPACTPANSSEPSAAKEGRLRRNGRTPSAPNERPSPKRLRGGKSSKRFPLEPSQQIVRHIGRKSVSCADLRRSPYGSPVLRRYGARFGVFRRHTLAGVHQPKKEHSEALASRRSRAPVRQIRWTSSAQRLRASVWRWLAWLVRRRLALP